MGLDKEVVIIGVAKWIEMSEVGPEFELVCSDGKGEVV
jgi:hypothetical protein